MKKMISAVLAGTMMVTSTAASAAKLSATPMVEGSATIRYIKSVPTLQLDDAATTVNVTPLDLDHGRLSFAIGAFNKAPGAFNFGVESITATLSDGTPVRVLTKDDLVKQAKNRAMWSMIGMAVVGGLAAASVASTAGQHNYYSTMYTPHGTYRYSGSYVNYTERALATGAVSGASGYAIGSIQNDLDNAIVNLGQNVLQTTTVDQGTSYAGMVVLDKIRVAKGQPKISDQSLTLTVNAGGKQYPFKFELN